MNKGLPPFVAIDFETGCPDQTSACSVGVVRVEGGRVVERLVRLIRPPMPIWRSFTRIHGITDQAVRDQGDFMDAWAEVFPLFDDVNFIAAHNASFDAGVLRACCALHDIPLPEQPWVCTVRVAKRQWKLRYARLPDVCRFLAVPLNHHDALSDAEACARIVIAAQEEGCPDVCD